MAFSLDNCEKRHLESDGFSIEESFLLLALREAIRGRKLDPTEHRSAAEAIAWNRVLELAFENRVATVVYFAIGAFAKAGLVPSEPYNTLRRFFHETAQKNLRIKQCLSQVLSCFEQCGIEVLLLKGAALAYTEWPNMAMRQMHDVDLLVRRADVVAAAEALESIGFTTQRKHTLAWYRDREETHLPEYTSPNDSVKIELHQYSTNSSHFDSDNEGLWRRATGRDLDGIPFRVLAPNDQLLNLCLHVTCGHLLEDNMRSLLDITLVSQRHRSEIDLPRWRELLQSSEVGLLLKFSLCPAVLYLGASFDRVIADELRDFRPLTGWRRAFVEHSARKTLFSARARNLADQLRIVICRNILFRPYAGFSSVLLGVLFSERKFRRTDPIARGERVHLISKRFVRWFVKACLQPVMSRSSKRNARRALRGRLKKFTLL